MGTRRASAGAADNQTMEVVHKPPKVSYIGTPSKVYFMKTKKAIDNLPDGASPLHIGLARRIVRMINDDKVQVGTRLNEKRLSELLGVSRTPVRAALTLLGELGFV